ncbi:hypothetical protein [Shewanella halifaxensis]|uniref:hypothetical protein n=1 Tax=Shewanella halifaxensis TaxID=271098 RepID=UPI000D5999A9|nr:hypothetical protein [Shewanella halifaxensis]
MLRKTLIALAVASVATAATAADVTDTASALLSKQGAVNTANVQIGNAAIGAAAGDVLVSLEAEYKPDDLLYFNFVGGDVDLTKSVITTDVQLYDDAAETNQIGTMVLGLLPSSTKNQLVMRVTSLDYNVSNDPLNTTKFGKLVVNGLTFNTTSILSSGKTTLAYRAETASGIEIDAGKNATTVIFEAKDQFAAETVHPMNAIIDVNEQRLKFVSQIDGDSTSTDTVVVETSEVTAPQGKVWALPAAATKSDYVIHGDFSFLGKVNDNGTITTSNVTSSVDAAPKVYADKIVTTYNGLTANVITVDISGETAGVSDKALTPQEFTATTTVSYTDFATKAGSVVLQDKAEAGAWGLNGAIVHVPFMPFRDGYSPIISVSNTSNQDGDIEVLVYHKSDAAWVEPTSYMLNTTAKAEAMTDVTAELKGLGIDGDVAFDVIVNAPSQAIAVNALYFNNGDRAVLETHKRN